MILSRPKYLERYHGQGARTGWIGPAFGGLAVGAIVAGGPLGYYVKSLQTQVQDVSALASERDSTVASLESKLKAVNLAAADTAEQLRVARSEATANAHQLEEQRALCRELAKPELPLQLEVHKGLLTSGYVLQIRNPSRNDIAVAATFQSPDSHKMERGLVIDAGVGVNIGELEGRTFGSRDTVTLTAPGHKEIIFVVPVF